MTSGRRSTRIATRGGKGTITDSSLASGTRSRVTRSRLAAEGDSSTGVSTDRAALDNPAGLFSQRFATLSNTLKGYQTKWKAATELETKAQESQSVVPTVSAALLELVEGLRVFENDLAPYELESYSECVDLLSEVSETLSKNPTDELLTDTEQAGWRFKDSVRVWRDGDKGPINAKYRKDALASALEDLKILNGKAPPQWMTEGYTG